MFDEKTAKKKIAKELARLRKKNNVALGPEYAGCFNTGRRARILFCATFIAVGTENDFNFQRNKIKFFNKNEERKAKNLFIKMCMAVLKYNYNVTLQAQQEIKNYKTMDYNKKIKAAYKLNDLGLF